ncbi:diacylglycerol kinase family protein [Candidatus Daviesbacteria bacterium]|nr:diacylglycerol kinase family protein [Candidatus Daviesbacteria bacterium]
MEKKRSRFHHILSFKHAFEGLLSALKEEPNLKFHFIFAVMVLSAAYYFQITALDWIIIIVIISIVLALELTNTAIEAIVDSFTIDQHPRAKYAKDIGAAAVLLSAIFASIVGIIIFWPYLFS